MEEDRPMIHVRLPKGLVKRVDHVSVEWEKDRARTIERLLELALETVPGHDTAPELALVGANR
ncbi:MAG: hypothetical protein IH933_03715 [Euryarchaeota archaeon]|nr:hypothetical protein [Euryarchaeota archaeon]